ncbi:hypothetical protein HRbin30_02249 [bacterium HR30]|nr:hypothetical protein HRbin30_02249 [bacterium HR30]
MRDPKGGPRHIPDTIARFERYTTRGCKVLARER